MSQELQVHHICLKVPATQTLSSSYCSTSCQSAFIRINIRLMNEEWVTWINTAVCRVQYAYTTAAAVVINCQLVLCVVSGRWPCGLWLTLPGLVPETDCLPDSCNLFFRNNCFRCCSFPCSVLMLHERPGFLLHLLPQRNPSQGVSHPLQP